VSYGLLVVPQNQWENEDSVRYVSRTSGLLHLEVCWARVSQSNLKTGGGATRMVHVSSSWRLRGDEAEDRRVNAMGCIRLFYSNFTIFVVLGHKCSLVINFPIQGCDRTTSEMRGCLPRSYRGILDEARMRKHTHISKQYQI
jgi:hypothetical protein